MNYSIKMDQRTIMYLRQVLSQRPYMEVAAILYGIDSQVDQQDLDASVPVQSISIVDNGRIRPMTPEEIGLTDK